MSLSQQYREEGNHILSTAGKNLSPVVWEGRVTSALAKYNAALTTATNKHDKASAAKNYAVGSRKLADFHNTRMVTKNMKLILYHFGEAIKHYCKAYKEGRGRKSSPWLKDIKSKLSTVLQESYDFAKDEDLGHGRICILDKMLEAIEYDNFRGECYIEIGQVYFKSAVLALDKKNFRDSLSLLKECYRPVEEAKKYGSRSGNKYVLFEVEVIEKDVFLQTCIAESIQARVIGDDMLAKALKDYENLPMSLIWEVMDWYKKSTLLAREQDIEVEAVAYAKIGKVYHRVLKMTSMGKMNYKKSLEMVATLHPRTFNTEEWYKECASGLAEIQKDSVLEEEKRKDEERKKIIKCLKNELEELDTHKDTVDLLKFVYKRFPPKNPKHVLVEGYDKNMRKTLCVAIQHYHPDKIDAEVHGFKWKVMSEEITKRLTNKYECSKGIN
ncbi:hypothetical protein Pcinc_015779 [Petrolisthes cinctipes]|uniref:Uncharacterized protein n=1 Tax=Petrolisthes cinctipes TaxID=88211 RepID=A0AAE1FTR3_PETCI|nr:hypothetical protein Pcinc_015779 [Petrolisthes cinctipes]